MMRTVCLVVSFLLLALAAKPLPRVAADDDDRDAVYDTDGKKLKAGTKYYILPVNGNRGGLTLYDNDSDRCSYNVAQDRSDGSYGLAVTFRPERNKKGTIYLDTDLNIKFSDSSRYCGKSNVWTVDNYDRDSDKRRYIRADGEEGKHGRDKESSWFKIERDGNYYKLRSCPDCDGCSGRCRDLGIYDKGSSKRFLATTDDALRVKFQKV